MQKKQNEESKMTDAGIGVRLPPNLQVLVQTMVEQHKMALQVQMAPMIEQAIQRKAEINDLKKEIEQLENEKQEVQQLNDSELKHVKKVKETVRAWSQMMIQKHKILVDMEPIFNKTAVISQMNLFVQMQMELDQKFLAKTANHILTEKENGTLKDDDQITGTDSLVNQNYRDDQWLILNWFPIDLILNQRINSMKLIMIPRVLPENYPDVKSLILSRRVGRYNFSSIQEMQKCFQIVNFSSKFACNHCDKEHTSKYYLSIQKQEKHGYLLEYQCEWCDQAYETQKGLFKHYFIYHRDKKSTQFNIQCPLCSKYYVNEKSLKDHLRYYHQDQNKFKCDFFDKSFYKQQGLDRHLKMVHQIKNGNYQCEFCPKQYDKKQLLQKHVQNYHQEHHKYKCEVCDKTFMKQFGLDVHVARYCKNKDKNQK